MRIIVTAGPTKEMWDSVRFISNLSSGKTGYAIARCAYNMGSEVTLISGKNRQPPEKITYIPVFSALDMFKEVEKNIDRADIFISTAAVSDFRPVRQKKKISKKNGMPRIKFRKNPDILKWVGENYPQKLIVGFSLSDEVNIVKDENKLQAKSCDIMVFNTVQNMGQEHKTFILSDGKNKQKFKNIHVQEMAKIILEKCQKKI